MNKYVIPHTNKITLYTINKYIIINGVQSKQNRRIWTEIKIQLKYSNFLLKFEQRHKLNPIKIFECFIEIWTKRLFKKCMFSICLCFNVVNTVTTLTYLPFSK